MRNNAMWNCKNPHQGTMPKVLCLCSAGLLRSPTIAWVMSNNDYNTRAAGIYDYALVEMDEVLIAWADLIVCANTDVYKNVINKVGEKPIYDLKLPDVYGFREKALVTKVKSKLKELELI